MAHYWGMAHLHAPPDSVREAANLAGSALILVTGSWVLVGVAGTVAPFVVLLTAGLYALVRVVRLVARR